MPIDPSERVKFLTQIHLFNGLDEEQFAAVADELTEETFPAGKVIIQQGVEDDRLYLVWSGKVTVTRSGKQPLSATLVAGDHFGEEGMLVNHKKQSAVVTAIEATTALVLTREQFQSLAKQAPCLKTNITVSLNSHRLEQRIHFKWLQENEVVYFLARKHSVSACRGVDRSGFAGNCCDSRHAGHLVLFPLGARTGSLVVCVTFVGYLRSGLGGLERH